MAHLLVFIPTYDRYDLVVNQVHQIQNQLDAHQLSEVTILVLDNASRDLRYLDLPSEVGRQDTMVVRNSAPLGLVGNLITGVGLDLDWDYIWPLSDDDYLGDQALPTVVDELNTNPASAYYMLAGIKGDENLRVGYEFNSLRGLLQKFAVISTMGLISANIYSRRIRDYLPEMYLYGYTLFPFVAAFLKLCQSPDFSVRVLPKDIVTWRPGSRSWSKIYDMALNNVLYLSELISDPKTKRRFVRAHLRNHGASHVGGISIRSLSSFRRFSYQIGVARVLVQIAKWAHGSLRTFVVRHLKKTFLYRQVFNHRESK